MSILKRDDAMLPVASFWKCPLGRVLDVGVGVLISLNTLVRYSVVMRCRPWYPAAESQRS